MSAARKNREVGCRSSDEAVKNIDKSTSCGGKILRQSAQNVRQIMPCKGQFSTGGNNLQWSIRVVGFFGA
jgi:hypothetical protein